MKYKMFISSHLYTNVPLKNETEIQEAIETLNATLHNAVLVATPASHNNTNKDIKYPRTITDLIQEKRELRRQWQRHRSPGLKSQLKQCQKTLQSALKEHI